MVLILCLAFGGLVALWWVVGLVADALVARGAHVADSVVVRVLPGHLPSYVREDYARARHRLPGWSDTEE
ncbi:hypothetical protein ACF08A_25790 [Streptomyces cellulosae]